ncbi:MAG: MerR family transcriptional regulator [Bacteroidia bacterium]
MASTKRYYTLREAADLLRVPVHQLRRWVRTFLDLPTSRPLRIPAEKLSFLQQVRMAVYEHRLHGQALRDFLRHSRPLPPSWDWETHLTEILNELTALEKLLQPPQGDL